MRKRTWRTICLVAVVVGLLAVSGPVVQTLTHPGRITLTESEYAQLANLDADCPVGNDTDGPKYITLKLFGFIPIKKVAVDILPFETVLVGGTPLGLCGQIDGVLVTADQDPLKKGDVIRAVNDQPVSDLTAWQRATADQSRVKVTLQRGQKTITRPVAVSANLPLRDTTNGVGMLTFVNPENHTFAALGHQMSDFATGAAVDLTGGSVHTVNVFGLEPTQARTTGVLKGTIREDPCQGSITKGDQFGVTGCFSADSTILAQTTTSMPVATRYHVKPGAATLRTSLDGVTVEEFSCEILKPRWQARRDDKSMVIRITDERLLSKTGGIIHGMSGSPIIQDGHLVGALTHAITHDPAKGYALYVDFMTI